MALGLILKEARERKGLTPQQVAEATRMMVQVVEDLEREDFRRIAAPLYGRGFIKLYAECVGVDPEPLVCEFVEIYTGNRPPQIVRRAVTPAASAPQSKPNAFQPRAAPVVMPLAHSQAESVPDHPVDASTAEPACEDLDPEVMPLDERAEPAPPDLFTGAGGRKPPVVRAKEQRPVSVEAHATPPRVRPFSGDNLAEAEREEPPKQAISAPVKNGSAPGWTKPRVVVQEVAKIWSGMSRLPPEWLTMRRMAMVAGVAAGAIIVLLGIRFLIRLADASASRTVPVLSERVHPPPPPYVD